MKGMTKMDRAKAAAMRIVKARGREMSPLGHQHVCSKGYCNPLGEVELIDAGKLPRNVAPIWSSVYVCVYREMHICGLGECNAYLDTLDGVCPITGFYIAHAGGDKIWMTRPEKRTARYRRTEAVQGRMRGAAVQQSAANARITYTLDDDKAGAVEQLREHSRRNVFGVLYGTTEASISPPPPPESTEAQRPTRTHLLSLEDQLRLEREGKGDDDDDAKNNYGNGGDDDNEKEEALITLPGKPLKNGSSSNSRKRSTPSPSLTRTNSSRGNKRGAVASKKKTLAVRREEAEYIITQLLYSDDRRLINEEKRAKLNAQRDQVIRNYYAEREGVTFPILTEVLNRKAAFDMQLPHLRILKRDDKRISHYVDIVMQTWKVMTESPWGERNRGARFEAHVLSILYKLRKGLVINDIPLIPKDVYMYNLPVRIDLPLFGHRYESSTVTSGIKNISEAYHSALDAGWPLDALIVKGNLQ